MLKDHLNKTLTVFKENISLILIIALLIATPIAVVDAFILTPAFDFDSFNSVLNDYIAAQGNIEENEELYSSAMSQMNKFVFYYLASFILSSFTLICSIAAMLITKNSKESVKSEFSDIFEDSIRSFPKVFVVSILVSVVIAGGFMLCFIPGIYFMIVLSLAVYVTVFLKFWGPKALSLSTLIFKKNFMQSFLYVIVPVIIFSAYNQISNGIISYIPAPGVVGSVITIVKYTIDTVLQSIIYIFTTLYFLDIKETIDISMFTKKTTAPQNNINSEE